MEDLFKFKAKLFFSDSRLVSVMSRMELRPLSLVLLPEHSFSRLHSCPSVGRVPANARDGKSAHGGAKCQSEHNTEWQGEARNACDCRLIGVQIFDLGT